jgi:hypothetical protein
LQGTALEPVLAEPPVAQRLIAVITEIRRGTR